MLLLSAGGLAVAMAPSLIVPHYGMTGYLMLVALVVVLLAAFIRPPRRNELAGSLSGCRLFGLGGAASATRLGVFRLQAAQQAVDAVTLRDCGVDLEAQLGGEAELQPFADLRLQVGPRARETLQHALLRVRVTEDRHEHARVLQVGREIDAGDRHHLHARILDVAQEQLRERHLQQCRDPIAASTGHQ